LQLWQSNHEVVINIVVVQDDEILGFSLLKPQPQEDAAPAHMKQVGNSRDSKTFTNTSGQGGRVDYARRYNPSKGRRFRGYTDSQENYHDID
jgi:hypothetical protein